MIKTLKITGFLAVLATVACVAMLAIFGLKGDPEIRKVLDSESAVALFRKKTTKASSANDQVSPLVKQAKALALRINPPPKPKPVAKKTPRPTPGKSKSIPTPKVAKVNTKFDLIATCKYEDQPEKSMALLDLPAKGLQWFRQGQEINHLIIQQINDGNIVLYKGGVENSVATMPVVNKKSLLKSEAGLNSKPGKPTNTPRTNAGPANAPLQIPEGSTFPKDIFERLTGKPNDDQAEGTETPRLPRPRSPGKPTQRTVRKRRPLPEPISEEKRQENLEGTISNIKRIMSENAGESGRETNETFKKLLETLEAEKEEKPNK